MAGQPSQASIAAARLKVKIARKRGKPVDAEIQRLASAQAGGSRPFGDQAPETTAASVTDSREIAAARGLLDEGVITPAEFDQLKAKARVTQQVDLRQAAPPAAVSPRPIVRSAPDAEEADAGDDYGARSSRRH